MTTTSIQNMSLQAVEGPLSEYWAKTRYLQFVRVGGAETRQKQLKEGIRLHNE